MTGPSRSSPPLGVELGSSLTALFRVAVALDGALDDPGLFPEATDGIGLTGALTLVLIDTAGPLRPGTIGDLTSLTSAGVSHLLERLERAGFVTRAFGAVPGDRRAVVVGLSAAGRNALITLDQVVATFSGDLVRTLDAVRTHLPEPSTPVAAPATPPTGTCSPVLGSLLHLTVLIDASIAHVVGDSAALPPTEARPHLLLQEAVSRGGLQLSEIPELIGRSRGATHRLVGRLEAEGLLERARDAAGGRTVVVVRPTPRGRAVAETVLARLAGDLPAFVPAIDAFVDAVRNATAAPGRAVAGTVGTS